MVKLVVAEKPSVARDLARVLGAKTKRDGYFEGEGLRVTWCFGHMVQLVEPDAYNPLWKSWRRDQLPMLPEPFKLSPIASSADQWRVLKRLMSDRDVDVVVNGCDAGREGELIFRYVYELSGCNKPMERLWLASLTDQAVRKAWGQLKAGADYDALADAARCRAEADWLVGMNATRALTIQARAGAPGGKGALMSVGRVQTPTLAMVVQREQAIESFVPRAFWQIYCTFGVEGGEPPTYEGMWFDPEKERARKKVGKREGAEWEDMGEADPARLWDKPSAEAVLEAVRGQPGEVKKMEQRDVRERPPLLFDLTGLQRAANQRYGFSAQHTLDIAQALYEKHKLLTYPRTDSNYLTSDMKSGLERIVNALNTGPWAPFCDYLLDNLPLKTSSRIINDAEVGDHHAIIPTDRAPSGEGLSADEKRLYDMVVRRFLAAFYPDAVFATTRIETQVAEHMFVTRGRMRKEAGWQEVEPTAADRGAAAKDAKKEDSKKKGAKGEQDAGPALPLVQEGDAVSVERAKLHEGQTQPPRRFTESTLLGAMERAGQELDDEAMRRAMKEAGLGTPATRASMIETLLKRQYIEREGKALVPTQAGRALIEAIPTDDLKSAALTGQWEARLARVAGGKVSRAEFMEETRALCARLVRDLLAQRVALPPGMGGAGGAGEVLGRCPVCRGEVTEGFHTYSCSGGKQCSFVIFKKVAGKDIKPNLVKLLLSGKTSQVFKGFRSKSGKSFEAALRLDEEGKVALVFDGERAARSPSPRAPADEEEAEPIAAAPAKKARARRAAPAADAEGAGEAPAKRTRAKKAAPAAEVDEAPAKPKRARAKKVIAAEEVAPQPDEAPRAARRAPAPQAEATSPEGMGCPMCKEGQLMRGKRGWGCTRWREGCRFVIWQREGGEPRSDQEIAEIVRAFSGAAG